MATPPSDLLALAERTAQADRLAEQTAGFPAEGFTLLAVGGYGRRHLFPHSDVDLLLLFASERLAIEHKEVIAAYLQRLWDAGLRVSHSVRTPAECLEVHHQNIELNVSLLDQRYLTGDRAQYAEMARRLPRFLQASREPLVRDLTQLARERHARYADTFYHLEPNVKETPGGLRDYQLVRWLDQLDPDSPGNGTELDEEFRYLAAVRGFLHREAGRDQNLLSFDSQDALAELWQDADAALWMRRYYRHARAVYRAAIRRLEAAEVQSSSLFAQFRDWRGRLGNTDFSVHRDRAHFRAPQQLDLQPEFVLELFEFVARHGVRPSAEAGQQIEERLPRLRRRFAEPLPLWPALSRILTLPHAALALRSMHDTGVLTALFPELEQIECLVVRDFYHRYTVDEHTLVAIESLTRAGSPFSDLRAELLQPATLLYSLLFHDAGKSAIRRGACGGRGAPGRNRRPAHPHARAGARGSGLPDSPPSGSFPRHAVARHLRSADPQGPGPPGGDHRAPESAHPAHLRRYQRRQPHRDDPLARPAALAALHDPVSRADARTGNRAPRRRALGIPPRPSHPLPAHAYGRGDPGAHGAGGPQPGARRGGQPEAPGIGLAAHPGGG